MSGSNPSRERLGRGRPRWACRLFGHRFRDPVLGRVIHCYLPSAEGGMGPPDDRPIGICGCGARWER